MFEARYISDFNLLAGVWADASSCMYMDVRIQGVLVDYVLLFLKVMSVNQLSLFCRCALSMCANCQHTFIVQHCIEEHLSMKVCYIEAPKGSQTSPVQEHGMPNNNQQ